LCPRHLQRFQIARFGLGRAILGQQQIAFEAVDLRLDITFAGVLDQQCRLAQGGETLTIAAATGQRLRQQDQVIGALEPGAGCAMSHERLADLGHRRVMRVQH